MVHDVAAEASSVDEARGMGWRRGVCAPVEERLRRWSAIDPATGCHNWIGGLTPKGYGRMRAVVHGRVEWRAHRVAYAVRVGPIQDGLVIDHIYRNRGCCNPAHLRAVTPRVNALENSNVRLIKNGDKTHCKHGHEFTPENTMVRRDSRGGWQRSCRECSRSRARRTGG
jgi:hypothetical protein